MREPCALLRHLWNAGVVSVSGRRAVAAALREDASFSASVVIAVGKAACSMFLGAQPCRSPSTRSIIATKYGHVDPACRACPATEVIEAGHPVPDEKSIIAGEKILQAISEAEARERLLLLISGGASAVVEALRPGCDLKELQEVTRNLLSSGKSIREINAIRARMSRIKRGRLLGRFRGTEARIYALSDVQGDELPVIGGGIGDPCRAIVEAHARIVGSNIKARSSAAIEAARLGVEVRLNEESLYGDVGSVAAEISERLVCGFPGVYIWGGESTIELPPNPGTGGRNQSLALAIAGHIRGRSGISVLVAGTDGTDGPTEYAGACVDGATVDDPEEAMDALRGADAGTYLGRRQSLFRTGPTDTNVMDLVIALVT